MVENFVSGPRTLRIAAVFGQASLAGGGNTYEHALAKVLREWAEDKNVSITWFAERRVDKEVFAESTESVIRYKFDIFDKILAVSWPFSFLSVVIRQLIGSSFERKLRRHRIDLVYFLSPNVGSAIVSEIPIILTHWDVGHLDLPFLPETGFGLEWYRREIINAKSLPRAFHVFTDSDYSKDKLASIYSIPPERLTSLGMKFSALKARGETHAREHHIDRPYFIYPAGKWPHKNHITILRAMSLLIQDFPEALLVLTGTDKGNGAYLVDSIGELGLERNVLDFGFVTETQLDDLIEGAIALLMPSAIGPTNIPPLEANELGTRALISDAHHFDATEDVGFLTVPTFSVAAWHESMREVLITRGPQSKVKSNPRNIGAELNRVLGDFQTKRTLWR